MINLIENLEGMIQNCDTNIKDFFKSIRDEAEFNFTNGYNNTDKILEYVEIIEKYKIWKDAYHTCLTMVKKAATKDDKVIENGKHLITEFNRISKEIEKFMVEFKEKNEVTKEV